MRDIHPEILDRLDTQKSDAATVWKTSDDDKVIQAVKQLSEKPVGHVSNLRWKSRLTMYYAWVLTVLKSGKLSKDAAVQFMSQSFDPPFREIVEKCKYQYSYHMLTRMEEYSDMCNTVSRFMTGNVDGPPSTMIIEAIQTHNIARFSHLTWKKAGKKTYVVAPKLAEALKATKLSKYPSDLLRAPAQSCYVEFPPGAFVFTTYSDSVTPSSTGFVSLPVEGAYILEDTSPIGLRLWRVVVICQYKDKPSDNVHINHFYIPLKEGVSVDSCLDEAVGMMKGETEYSITVPDEGSVGKIGGINFNNVSWDDRIVNSAKDIFKFLMNVVIYVTRADSDATFVHVSPEYENFKARMLKAQGKKREDLKERIRKLNPGTRVLLGKSYTIKRWDNEDKIAGESTGRHITVRTLVSGHWRNQACGVGKLEHKTIWIEPFWRGPEAAPLTSKRAVVK